MTTAIIYTRFSPRRNADKSESIETQLDYCREYCKQNDYEIAGEFEDRALSGCDENRPGLWAAVAALRKGFVLLTYRADRLARGVYLAEFIRRECIKKHATLESVHGGTEGDSPEDVLVRHVMTAFSEYERKVIAARTKAAMIRHQRAGRRMSDKCPFGMGIDPVDCTRMIPDPVEQDTITKIVGLRRSKMGFRQICRWLEKEEIDCRGNSKWYHQTVKKILERAGA